MRHDLKAWKMEEDCRLQRFLVSSQELHTSLESSGLCGFWGTKLTLEHPGNNYQMSLAGGCAALCHLHAELSLAESSLAEGTAIWRLP